MKTVKEAYRKISSSDIKRVCVKIHHICTYVVSHHHASTNYRSEKVIHVALWPNDTSRTSEMKRRKQF